MPPTTGLSVVSPQPGFGPEGSKGVRDDRLPIKQTSSNDDDDDDDHHHRRRHCHGAVLLIGKKCRCFAVSLLLFFSCRFGKTRIGSFW